MTASRLSYRPAAIAIAVGVTAALATALWFLPASRSRWWLPIGLAFGIAAHVYLARALKAVLGASLPLASGAPEAGSYVRAVYGTPGRATLEIAGLAVAAGLLFGVALTVGSPWLGWGGAAVLAGALALDVRRWERVAASADFVWFQRGFGQKVHQIAIENIRDISISERDDTSFTLRHLRRNRVCRLNLRMEDKRVVALPKTDAYTGLEGVESVANHIRTRQQLAAELAARRQGGARPPAPPSPDDKAMRRELRRLRAAADKPAMPTLDREITTPEEH